jgi:serine/threonine protein kinase
MNESDLDEYIKQKIFLDEYEASIIMKQLIEAMIYLNSLGLIHRDLKA